MNSVPTTRPISSVGRACGHVVRRVPARAGVIQLALAALVAALALEACQTGMTGSHGGTPIPTLTPVPTPTPGMTNTSAIWQCRTQPGTQQCEVQPGTQCEAQPEMQPEMLQCETVYLTNVPKLTVTVEELRGQIFNFQTSDQRFFCFENVPINVWKTRELGDTLLAFGTCPTGVEGYWIFSEPLPKFTATAIWKGQTVTLVFTTSPDGGPAPNVNKVSTAYEGQVTNFSSTNSDFFCLNNLSLSVYLDPDHYLGQNVVQETCNTKPGTWSTWVFPHPFHYYAVWHKKQVVLTYQPGDSLLNSDSYVDQATDFSTDDPRYTLCLNGGVVNVYFNQTLDNANYRVFGNCPGGPTGLTIGAWTFTRS